MGPDTRGCWVQELWNGSWNGMPRNPSAISAISAIRRAACAGHRMSAKGQAPRNAPLTNFRLSAAPRSGHVRAPRRDVARRRCGIGTNAS